VGSIHYFLFSAAAILVPDPTYPIKWAFGIDSRELQGRGVKLTTRFCIVTRLGTRTAITIDGVVLNGAQEQPCLHYYHWYANAMLPGEQSKEEHRLRVSENRVLRRIFEPKRNEVKGECRKLELRDLYSSPSLIRIIKSRRVRWAGHVARMVRVGMHISYWWESQRERDH
jgi:hypothetical protein